MLKALLRVRSEANSVTVELLCSHSRSCGQRFHAVLQDFGASPTSFEDVPIFGGKSIGLARFHGFARPNLKPGLRHAC